MGKNLLSWMDDDDNDEGRLKHVPRTRMGGAPPLLAMNGQGYTVVDVHNESSASGQAPE